MKRAMLVAMAAAFLWGGLAVAQPWCPPPCPPPPPAPPCYATFWAGEPILIELVIPWGIFCGCCCQARALITGWRVEAFGGGVVYAFTYPTPVDAGTKIVWDQKDLAGTQVAFGFYKIVVTTTDREVEIHVKIAQRQDCCFFLFLPFSKPCGFSLCQPHLRVSRACPTPCAVPCGRGFLFFFGSGG